MHGAPRACYVVPIVAVVQRQQRCLRVLQVFRGDPQEARSFALRGPGFAARPTCVTLGPEASDTFCVPPGPLPPAYPLLRAVGDEFILRLHPGMSGRLHLGGVPLTVAQLFAAQRGIAVDPAQAEGQAGLRELPLGDDDWGIVATDPSGAQAFLFQLLPVQPSALPRPPLVHLDPFFLRGLAFAAVIHLSVLALGYSSREPFEPLALEPAAVSRRLAHITIAGPGVAAAAPLPPRPAGQRRITFLPRPLPPLLSDAAPPPPPPGPPPAGSLLSATPTELLFGVPSASAGYPVGPLNQLLSEHRADLLTCVQRHLPPGPAPGPLALRFALSASGAPSQVQLDAPSVSTPGAPAPHRPLSDCLAALVARWRLPAAASPTLITLPFTVSR